MKKAFLAVFTGITICLCLAVYRNNSRSYKAEVSNSSIEFRVLVKFSPNLLPANLYEIEVINIENADLRGLLLDYKVASIRAVFKNRYDSNGYLKDNLAPSNTHFLEDWRIIPIANLDSANLFIASVNGLQGIEQTIIETPVFFEPAFIPDDTFYENQWHLNDPYFPNADIRAEGAWQINKGRNDVIIAILDGGVDYTHPDLDPGDRSRIIAGYDTGDGNSNPMDDLPDSPDSYGGHGTNIAGVVGAITNNDQGVAGIMWNCQVMPVKMVRSGGIRIPHILNWEWNESAFPSDVADAIDYAVNNDAHIINLSYSFPSMGWLINEVALRIPLLFQSLNNAYNNNLVITASMGNQESSDVRYPAGFIHQVIAVGATNRFREKASFSNTGPHINVSAPGVGILTTERYGGTRSVSGTSFSSPIVAGVAGLIISQGKDRGFNLTNDDVRNILERTADDIELYGIGFDYYTGHGKVNAHAALQFLSEPNEVVHGVSYGGSTTKTILKKWVYIGSKWGLAAGMYLDVDRYKVTKRINFDVPFCSPPVVWMRDRQSACLSAANPNDGYPYAEISNITETGFDVTYYTYFFPTSLSGATINKWVPATIPNSKVAYTAVGELNIAGTAGPISGPSTVCTSNAVFTLNNLPEGCTITWSHTPGLLTYVSGQGTASYTVQAASSFVSGSGTVSAVITGPCGPSQPIIKTVWVGKPSTPFAISGFPYNGYVFGSDTEYEFRALTSPGMGLDYYNWVIGCGSIVHGQGTDDIIVRTCTAPDYMTMYFDVSIRVGNECGLSDWLWRTGYVVGESGATYMVYPNPASSEITVALNAKYAETNPEKAHELSINQVRIMDHMGKSLMLKNFYSQELSVRINISALPKGYYIVKINEGESHTILKD